MLIPCAKIQPSQQPVLAEGLVKFRRIEDQSLRGTKGDQAFYAVVPISSHTREIVCYRRFAEFAKERMCSLDAHETLSFFVGGANTYCPPLVPRLTSGRINITSIGDIKTNATQKWVRRDTLLRGRAWPN